MISEYSRDPTGMHAGGAKTTQRHPAASPPPAARYTGVACFRNQLARTKTVLALG